MATTDVALDCVSRLINAMHNDGVETLDLNWQTPNGRSIIVNVRPIPDSKRGQDPNLSVRLSKRSAKREG